MDFNTRLAGRLGALRNSRGWTLAELAGRSGVSRATLSRLENGEVSPTAETLGKLCAAFGLPLSRLIMEAEAGFAPLLRRASQPVWQDPATGFSRRQVSPPAPALGAEIIEGTLPPGQVIRYETPPSPGQEHHLVMLEGRLMLETGGATHDLAPGDCLRYRLDGGSRFETGAEGARYLLVLL